MSAALVRVLDTLAGRLVVEATAGGIARIDRLEADVVAVGDEYVDDDDTGPPSTGPAAGHLERLAEHLVLTPPFLWPDLEVVDESGGPDGTGPLLTRLQAVPITTAEMSAIAEDGPDAMFEKLDAADADVTDPDRPSVV